MDERGKKDKEREGGEERRRRSKKKRTKCWNAQVVQVFFTWRSAGKGADLLLFSEGGGGRGRHFFTEVYSKNSKGAGEERKKRKKKRRRRRKKEEKKGRWVSGCDGLYQRPLWFKRSLFAQHEHKFNGPTSINRGDKNSTFVCKCNLWDDELNHLYVSNGKMQWQIIKLRRSFDRHMFHVVKLNFTPGCLPVSSF